MICSLMQSRAKAKEAHDCDVKLKSKAARAARRARGDLEYRYVVIQSLGTVQYVLY